MESLPLKNNCKVLVKNLPGAMEECEFRILAQKFNGSICYFKYFKAKEQYLPKKNTKSKCYLQLSDPAVVKEFIEEFNKPFFDSKGEQFMPIAELAFYQEIAQSVANDPKIFADPEYLAFKEMVDKGEIDIKEEENKEVKVEKISQLLVSIKQEAEEKKKEEVKKPKNNSRNWKNKNKKWKKK